MIIVQLNKPILIISDEYSTILSNYPSSKSALQISIDKPINGYLTIINNSLFEQTINAQIQIDLTSYTGLVITHVYLFEKMLIIQPKQSMLLIIIPFFH